MNKKLDRTNAIVAICVWLSTLVVYVLTKAASLSLWDCGEFIAVSSILGIPHPPGTPLYVLVGRIFTLVPLFADISARVNFLSSLGASLAALFAYLSGVRILRPWLGSDGTTYGRILMYAGPACGAFFLAFGCTAWTNAVEAEVYGMSMMLVMAIMWLSLIYSGKRGTLAGERILLAIVYLAFLGIGVHMTTFLILPVCTLLFIFKKEMPSKNWFAVGALVVLELYLVFALSSRPGEIPYYVPIVICFVFYLFYMLSYDRIPRQLLLVGTGFLLSCMPLLGLVERSLARPLYVAGSGCFGALLLYALYLVIRYLLKRRSGQGFATHNLESALFVLTAGFMTLIVLTDLRGHIGFLVVSSALVAVIAVFLWRYVNLPVLISLGGVALVALGIMPFIYGILISTVLVLVLGFGFKVSGWRTALLIVLAAVLGFSVHLFIPVRSAQHPYINENNPSESLAATVSFLERKQYGSQSMIERMFKRRAEWTNQFGVFRRMGFWNFFQEQYGLTGRRFFVLFIIGLFGLWEVSRRRSEMGVFMVVLLFICTVGLVLYMNFADGMRQDPVTGRDYCEVRDRDYFFTPGFMLFGLAIGLGLSALVQFVRESIGRFAPVVRRIILATCLVVFLIPTYALARNWHVCDRSNNFIAYDYAWNLLMSADENAVLFTNGDNDTFPPWCMQEAYGVRKDVRIINLSLANGAWYIKQIRDYMNLELGWTDEQIRVLRPYRLPDGRTFRIQDQVIDAVIDNNAGRVPINFSVTVQSSARKYHGMQTDSLLTLSGMKYRFDHKTSVLSFAGDESIAFFSDPELFRYASFVDPDVYKNETTIRVMGNLTNALLMTADGLRKSGRFEESVVILKQALEIMPTYYGTIRTLAGLYAEQGETDSILALLEQYPQADKREVHLVLAKAYRSLDQPDRAGAVLDNLLRKWPTYRPALDEMMRLLIGMKNSEAIIAVLERWVHHNPGDEPVKEALQELINRLETGADSVGREM